MLSSCSTEKPDTLRSNQTWALPPQRIRNKRMRAIPPRIRTPRRISGRTQPPRPGQNTVANTATAQGPSQAGQALINSATNPSNTIGNISAFLSPYTQNVLNSQVALENQQNAIQQQGLQGAAASAGALGGDRLGVAQGVLGGQQTLANNATNAGILQQGYNQALGAAQTTAGQQLQGAGLAGTVGSSSANTGQLSQNLSQTLGQTQAATSNAQATAGTGWLEHDNAESWPLRLRRF